MTTTKLHEAASRGDTARIAELIAAGADMEAKDSWHRTPLQLAAKCGHACAITTLAGLGADLGARDPSGQAPLHLAAWCINPASPEIFRALTLAGADPNAMNHNGITALHRIAGRALEADPITCFIELGADVNARSNDGTTPLHAAARQSTASHVAISALIASGADPNARNKKGYFPLDLAQLAGNAAVCRVLEAAMRQTPDQPAPAAPGAGRDDSHLLSF